MTSPKDFSHVTQLGGSEPDLSVDSLPPAPAPSPPRQSLLLLRASLSQAGGCVWVPPEPWRPMAKSPSLQTPAESRTRAYEALQRTDDVAV